MFQSLFRGFARQLPARCEICRSWPARPVCPACVQRFAAPQSRCIRCALPLAPGLTACGACLHEPSGLDACHAAVSYGFPWAGLITRLKFRGEPGWATALADLMRAAPGIPQALQAADRVIPLPLSPQRLAERGYNQAMELARRLAPRQVDAACLWRVRETAPQTTLERAKRRRNVREAFAVDPQHAASLRGQHLVLVDDVMTSGATLAAAAQALAQAGAARITAVVLARTDELF